MPFTVIFLDSIIAITDSFTSFRNVDFVNCSSTKGDVFWPFKPILVMQKVPSPLLSIITFFKGNASSH